MENGSNLTNHFLIAMPALNDPNFFHTVTYICEHNDNGAMGIIINRPLDMQLSDVLQHMGIETSNQSLADRPVFVGGPVEEDRGFVLHNYERTWDSTMKITDELAITTSRDILESIAAEQGPQQFLVALGYAGWGEGQLEQELAQNSWLSGPADTATLFDLPVAERWQTAARSIGVDVNLLSNMAGHA
ncbi:MAG: YqgE/AlgH family protein [Chromatiales bacterium]|jgi:putative transcriptional regulator